MLKKTSALHTSVSTGFQGREKSVTRPRPPSHSATSQERGGRKERLKQPAFLPREASHFSPMARSPATSTITAAAPPPPPFAIVTDDSLTRLWKAAVLQTAGLGEGLSTALSAVSGFSSPELPAWPYVLLRRILACSC